MSKHSPRPWHVYGRDCQDQNGRVTAYTGGSTSEEAEANAVLIVACVNACAGLKSPAALPELFESIRAWWKEHRYDVDIVDNDGYPEEYNTYDEPPPFIAALAAATGESDHDE